MYYYRKIARQASLSKENICHHVGPESSLSLLLLYRRNLEIYNAHLYAHELNRLAERARALGLAGSTQSDCCSLGTSGDAHSEQPGFVQSISLALLSIAGAYSQAYLENPRTRRSRSGSVGSGPARLS